MLREMVQLISVSSIIFIIGVTFGYGQVSYQPDQGYHPVNPEVPRITASEAMSLYKQGKLILVDVASPERFRDGHIVGAISCPKENISLRKITLPNNFIFAFYCG